MKKLVNQALEIVERFESANSRAFDILSEKQPEDRYCVCSAISECCSMRTRSAFSLLSNGLIWDALIIQRTIIHGTAKMCYLLSSDDDTICAKRFQEYTETAPMREYGSMYPHICAMLKTGLFGDEQKKMYVEQNILEPTKEMKVTETTPQIVKDEVDSSVKHLNYLKISPVLKNELEYWGEMCVVFDNEYSVANSYVHMNHNAICEQINFYSKSEQDSRRATYAHVANKLFLMCALQCARSEVLFKRAELDPSEMRNIMSRDLPFIKMVDKFCAAETNDMLNR